MKKKMIERVLATVCAATMLAVAVTGCGGSKDAQTDAGDTAAETETAEAEAVESAETAEADGAEEIAEEVSESEQAEDTASTEVAAPFFAKGVYANYAAEAENPPKDYFYVFYDEQTGYTEDGNNGIGLPFSCVQEGNTVTFTFGGEGEEESVLTVSSVENGMIKGIFDDTDIEMVFEPLADADADNFNSQNYVNAANGSTEGVYEDPNGWSVRYDSSTIAVNQEDNIVTFVYTGESAGTNMVTVTYDTASDAKTYIEDRAKAWGDDVEVTESVFPGTEDVTGYWASLPPAEEGSGLYGTIVARDYMDGYLSFELTGHNSGDDEMDMAVSDSMAMIIDSLTFSDIAE